MTILHLLFLHVLLLSFSDARPSPTLDGPAAAPDKTKLDPSFLKHTPLHVASTNNPQHDTKTMTGFLAIEGKSKLKMSQHTSSIPELAGSTLPDCSHACEGCNPCKRVIISMVCAISPTSEACPIAYRCTCNGKSYPVP